MADSVGLEFIKEVTNVKLGNYCSGGTKQSVIKIQTHFLFYYPLNSNFSFRAPFVTCPFVIPFQLHSMT